MHRHVYRRIGTPLKLAAIGSTSVIFGSSLAAKRASLHRLKRILFDSYFKQPRARPLEHPSWAGAPAHLSTEILHRLGGQNIEILEPPKIEARAFLQFGQRHLIHCKTTRIEWRSRDRRSRLRRHYIGLIHLECGHCELALCVINNCNHLIERHRDLHSLIDGIGLLKDGTGKDRPLAVPAPLLRKDPVFENYPKWYH